MTNRVLETGARRRSWIPTYVGTVLIGLMAAATGCDRGQEADFVRLMNLGKAHLENRESQKAIEVLSQAVEREPRSAPALRNLARAFRLARKPERALAALRRAAALEPQAVATSYLMGLVLASQGRFKEAVPHFEEAVRRDPDTATLRFQLAGAYEAVGEDDKALVQLHETIRLDPLHASAQFKLVRYARRAGDPGEVQRRLREFMRLRKLFGDQTRTAAALTQCRYTRPEPAAMPAGRASSTAAAAIRVRFAEATGEVFTEDRDRAATTAAVLDVEKDGRCTIFLADGDGCLALLRLDSGTFRRTAIDLKLSGKPVFERCVIGNYHDDVPEGAKYDPKRHAFNDVLLFGPGGLRLLQRTGPKTFQDATDAAGLSQVTVNRAKWVDYEHDGDLDLLLARAGGLELWQNNGDGRFESVTAAAGLGQTETATDALGIDLEVDGAVDLIVARGARPTLVFKNRRAGRFAPMPEPPGPWPAAQHVLADDLNNDGRPDALLIRSHQATVLLSETPDRPRLDASGIDIAAATFVDYDNDGWLDVCLAGAPRNEAGAGALRLYRNRGSAGFHEVTEATGLGSLNLPPVTGVLAADLDGDADTDLLAVTSEGRLRFLRNEGGQANGQLKIRLTPLKTNPTGLGTHIELRDRSWWVTRTVTQLPIEIGLGGRTQLDAVQMIWTNGVVDNRVDLKPPAAPLSFVEKNVAAGSCPFLYAWDGHGFRFVTDLLGNAPIGLSQSRGVVMPADPDELVCIGDAATFPPRAGTYRVVLTDEFREVLYLDHARLVAVDHAPGVEVHPTDKLMAPPFPPSELWALGSPKRLIRATGDDGIDRTDAVRERDGVFAPPGTPLPPPFRGMCLPVSLTLDFGPLDVARPLVLALTGWLQYGDASTNIAMSQSAAVTLIRPMLEVETTAGDWRLVDANVGMPAGKTKTILCDLTGRLPDGARRLRLTTTFEIRWDRIALFERRALPPTRVHERVPSSADLEWHGFSDIKQRAPEHPTTPDFDTVSDQPPWRTALQGWCTRYGDVLELVTKRDDRLVLLNAGDALTLRFDAATLPPVPAGLARTFFFYSVGWDKDGDHNVVGGETVEPLPKRSTGAAVPTTATARAPSLRSKGGGLPVRTTATGDWTDWRLKHNTRWVPRGRFRPRGHRTVDQRAAQIRAGLRTTD